MFDLMITFEDKTCSHLTDYTSVWIILSLQQLGAGNFRVPIVRPLNSLRTKDSSTWWHLKLLQLTLAFQCPVCLCSLVMENLIGERFPAWHCSPRHTTTHTSNTEHHTSPGHVSEPELKASENSPDNGLTFPNVTLTLFAVLCGDYLHLSDYLRWLYVTFYPG
jgi:hypothetical protein